ncbi:MAG: spore germination protein [Bacillota bacterium]|nr:spore germination protein [Bacillota bacterium]
MFEKYIKYLKFMKLLKDEETISANNAQAVKPNYAISKNIDDNLKNLKSIFFNSDDIKFRELRISDRNNSKAFICYIEAMENKLLIDQTIVKALMLHVPAAADSESSACTDLVTLIKERVSNASSVSETTEMDKVLEEIVYGSCILFIDGYDRVLFFGKADYKTRSIEEPSTEAHVRGPREGFVEDIFINTTMLRRKIKNPNLVFESLKLGNQTSTKIRVAYIKGIANESIVDEVKRRLNSIQTDSILESGYIEQLIEDHPLSPFPTIGNSERPDKVAAKLLEGRVAIFCDGTPFVLTVPFLFIENIQVGEDYYSRPFMVFVLRLLRVISLNATILTPALYIALTTYHPDMLPSLLLITTAASREGIPFPSIIETLIMITAFELLRESGVRLPKQQGQALSIVGVLIIGEAAVRAGIIGATMIIIGAFTGITGFIVSPLTDSILIFRFFLIFLSGIFGFYGIVLGLIVMLAHTCSLNSFGVPYMSPIAPTIWSDLKDTFVRLPLWLLNLRPKSITPQYLRRRNLPKLDYTSKDKEGEDN